MRKVAALAAVVVLTLTGCGKGDDVDVNPDKGDDVPGNVGDKEDKEKDE
ncbi:MAG: hypothetical protein H0V23_09690 [Nocardioidaceae bacterium]|nr:hypothetical protein [Nocardioidaceae bacterium]